MGYIPAGLEAIFDPWAKQERDRQRWKAVAYWLMDLMVKPDLPWRARQTSEDPPGFIAEVHGQGIAISWTVLDTVRPKPTIAIDELYDMETGARWRWYWIGEDF